MPRSELQDVVPTLEQAKVRAFILRHVALYALANPPPAVSAQVFARWSEGEQAAALRQAEIDRDSFWTLLGPLQLQLSPRERLFAQTNMTTMTQPQRVAASWRTEALQILLWALDIVHEILPYDTAAGDGPIKAFSAAEFDKALISAELRPFADLAAARGIAETWLWRARTQQLIKEGRPLPQSPQLVRAGIKTYDDIVRATAQMAARRGILSEMIDYDFPLFGKAYRAVSEKEHHLARSIAVERLFVLNWLCGRAPEGRWDETPTDT